VRPSGRPERPPSLARRSVLGLEVDSKLPPRHLPRPHSPQQPPPPRSPAATVPWPLAPPGPSEGVRDPTRGFPAGPAPAAFRAKPGACRARPAPWSRARLRDGLGGARSPLETKRDSPPAGLSPGTLGQLRSPDADGWPVRFEKAHIGQAASQPHSLGLAPTHHLEVESGQVTSLWGFRAQVL
jgi:hypothetical protein